MDEAGVKHRSSGLCLPSTGMKGVSNLLSLVLFFKAVSCSSGWLLIHYVVKDDFELVSIS